jgi:hypothetical protein
MPTADMKLTITLISLLLLALLVPESRFSLAAETCELGAPGQLARHTSPSLARTTESRPNWSAPGYALYLASAAEGTARAGYQSVTSDSTGVPYGAALFGKPAFNRKILRDLHFSGKTFVSDALWLYSSPARVNRRSLQMLLGITAVGAGIYLLDADISAALSRNSKHWLYEPFHEIGEQLEPVGRQGTMNKYIFGTAVVSYIIGFERLARMSSEILESYLLAGIPKVAVNKMTGRPRPLSGAAWNRWNLFHPGQSFFSGHTSHAFQIARVMDEHIHSTPVDILLYVCAFSIGFQRIDTGWHWPSDVWVGGVYGYIVADALVGRHKASWLSVNPVSFYEGSPIGINVTARL